MTIQSGVYFHDNKLRLSGLGLCLYDVYPRGREVNFIKFVVVGMESLFILVLLYIYNLRARLVLWQYTRRSFFLYKLPISLYIF